MRVDVAMAAAASAEVVMVEAVLAVAWVAAAVEVRRVHYHQQT